MYLKEEDSEKKMWEILVPTQRNDGRPIRARFHRVWDEKVRNITNGLTINPVSKGQWMNDEQELFSERMIPVRISCTEEELKKVVEETLKHYSDQEAIMVYLVSDNVKVYYR